jgi:ferredoxin/flavodoxin
VTDTDADASASRGLICYYSATGNTRMACEYVAAALGPQCDLVDVVQQPDIDPAGYDFVGLAVPTDFGGMPHSFETFLDALPDQACKPAFVLNTYGFMSGRTILDLAEHAGARGFSVLAAHSLHMPENYPPMIKLGLGMATQPKPAVMTRFDAFMGELAAELATADRAEAGAQIRRPLRFGLMTTLATRQPRTSARADMGEKFVDSALCTECGTCAKRCPYGAIALDPTPVWDMTACWGCWRCYNQCPQHAIYTSKFRGGPYYTHPSERVRVALGRRR